MAYAKRGAATSLTWMNVVPTWNWQMVNFWATIAFAMSGMEFAGMMGAEIRDPERTLPRAADKVIAYGYSQSGSILRGFYFQRLNTLKGDLTFDEVRDRIRDTLAQQLAVQHYLSTLRRTTYIDIRL